MTESPRAAAIYVRISRDKVGAGLGVERQETDCRELAARLGWAVVEVFADNDLSAYSGKARPRYRTMLEAIRAGHVGAVLRRHLQIRDRACAGPGCRAPAHHTDQDHTVDHARGGPTLHWNLGASEGAAWVGHLYAYPRRSPS